jgi:hypothetical protein
MYSSCWWHWPRCLVSNLIKMAACIILMQRPGVSASFLKKRTRESTSHTALHIPKFSTNLICFYGQ